MGRRLKLQHVRFVWTQPLITYAGGISNLMHQLEAKHPSEYAKAKGEENDESYV